MPVLTGIDVLGVQRFVFSSNRLRDVVSGSFLVHWCTSTDGALLDLVSKEKILLAAGGNAIIEFDSLDEAKSFAALYSRLLYEEAPGLEVALYHKPYNPGGLAWALQEIQIDLARSKMARSPSVPQLGLSITASCIETGLPAIDYNSTGSKSQNTSTEIFSKNIWKRREQAVNVNRFWQDFLENSPNFDFPLELDQLGRDKGDTSLIGIVHVDGNRVGKKIKDWLSEKVNEEADDAEVRKEYRKWSNDIDELGQKALKVVVDRIVQSVEQSKDGQKASISGVPERLGFNLQKGKKSDRWMLPLRPVVLGGDDMTFICDGRVALDLAETALGIFEDSNIAHLGKITACAGIAIVRVHAPFARAYELSERLCRSAKKKLHETGSSGCALDWHIGNANPGETVEMIREKQYQSRSGIRLTCRPYRLGSGEKEPETWRWLSVTLLDGELYGIRGDIWSERRNKVKALTGLVREGKGSVQTALEAWRRVDNKLQLPQPIEHDGFIAESRTPLLDAIEILDLHVACRGSKKVQEVKK